MDRIQDHWAWIYRWVVLLSRFNRVNLFFHVILNNFYPLDNDVFKKPLSLFQGYVIWSLILLQFVVNLLLKLKVHTVFVVQKSICISYSCTRTKRAEIRIRWDINGNIWVLSWWDSLLSHFISWILTCVWAHWSWRSCLFFVYLRCYELMFHKIVHLGFLQSVHCIKTILISSCPIIWSSWSLLI